LIARGLDQSGASDQCLGHGVVRGGQRDDGGLERLLVLLLELRGQVWPGAVGALRPATGSRRRASLAPRAPRWPRSAPGRCWAASRRCSCRRRRRPVPRSAAPDAARGSRYTRWRRPSARSARPGVPAAVSAESRSPRCQSPRLLPRRRLSRVCSASRYASADLGQVGDQPAVGLVRQADPDAVSVGLAGARRRWRSWRPPQPAPARCRRSGTPARCHSPAPWQVSVSFLSTRPCFTASRCALYCALKRVRRPAQHPVQSASGWR